MTETKKKKHAEFKGNQKKWRETTVQFSTILRTLLNCRRKFHPKLCCLFVVPDDHQG